MINRKNVLKITLISCLIMLISVACGSSQTPTTTQAPVPVQEFTPTPSAEAEVTEPSEDVSATEIVEEVSSAGTLSVVYIKTDNAWLWEAGNPSIQLTESGSVARVAISDDGEVIAFERQVDENHSELWAVNSDANGERLLVSVEEFNDTEPEKWLEDSLSLVPHHFEFVPGTHTVAFNTRLTFEGPGLAIFDDLRLVDTDTGEKTVLLSGGQGGEFVYSPDGQQIAISTPTSIFLMNTDGSNVRQVLTYDMVTTYSEYSYYAYPTWATDSSSLRVAIPPADPLGIPRQATTLWSIPTDDSSATQLGSIMAAPFGVIESAFSPDFSHVIYSTEAEDPENNLRNLHLTNPENTEDEILLSSQYVAFNGWSPDSGHFIVVAGDPPNVQIGNLQKNFQPLSTETNGVGNVVWVSDTQFLFLKGGEGTWELRLGTIDGKSGVIDTIQGDPPPYDFSIY